jgi:hypothetical protein
LVQGREHQRFADAIARLAQAEFIGEQKHLGNIRTPRSARRSLSPQLRKTVVDRIGQHGALTT